MTPGRMLITGGGGFVGRALALGFARLGWEVCAVDRSFDDSARDHRVDQVVTDLLDPDWSLIPRVDVVVHAAWLTTHPKTLGLTAGEFERQNLVPLDNVLAYATRTSPEALVFVSSSGVFAADDSATGLTDALAPTGGTPYATSKLQGEALASMWGTDGVERTHVIRLGYLFGPHEVARPSREGISLIAHWMNEAREGRPLEVRADDPARDWTYTPDLAPALARLISGPSARRPIHFGSPHVVRDGELASWITAEIGGHVVTVPSGAPLKAPMVTSDIAAVRDVSWTPPRDGIRALLEAEAVA